MTNRPAVAVGRPPEPERVRLEGLRVLLVEDEFFVAVHLEETLGSFGCATIGPYTTLELATQASRRERLDLAVLDINLNGRTSYPLADELGARGVPYLFLTGYAGADLPEGYRGVPRLQKPVDCAELRRTIVGILSV
jgi:CheY-like chemotaxis protein